MTRSRFAHRVSRTESGQRLDVVVGAWLARDLARPLSKSAVRRLIMAGAVRLNGRPVRRPGLLLEAGSTLDALIDIARLQPASSVAPPDESRLAILYEDDDVIAVAKPAGLVMHRTADPARQDLYNEVRRLLARQSHDRTASGLRTDLPRGPTPRPDPTRGAGAGLPYLGLHHRLDVETSGVVLFATSERANAGLAAQFERGEVTKVYHAIVARGDEARARPGTVWRVDNRLATGGRGRSARMKAVAAGGVRAVTVFEVLIDYGQALLLAARPDTGRKHQIRAHLAGAGMPILGDRRYDGAPFAGRCAAPRVMLHAARLVLRHPVTDVPLDVTCPYPADFEELLACLKRQARKLEPDA